MRLEFRIPISATEGFFAQIHLYARSLARLGPPYSEAKIFVSMGHDADVEDAIAANPWAAAFPIEWYAVSHAICTLLPWAASGLGRYLRPSDADVVVLCDADTCPLDRFDEMLARFDRAKPLVAGLPAHYSPFHDTNNDATWRDVLDEEDLGHVPLTQRYSLDSRNTHGSSPPYFNYGMVPMNASAFALLGPVMPRLVGSMLGTFPGNPFFAQIALAIAIAKCGIETFELGHEYNCANDEAILREGLVDLDAIRIVHYLRTEELARDRFLVGADYDAFLSDAKHNPITERFRLHVAGLTS